MDAIDHASSAILPQESASSSIRGKGYRVAIERVLIGALFPCLGAFVRVFGADAGAIWALPFVWADAWKRRVDLPQLERLRAALPDAYRADITTRRHFRTMIWNWYLSGMAVVLYPQMRTKAWRRRFTVIGTPPWKLPGWGTRPVVLAFLHTGAFPVLPFWLRSRGVPTAFVLGGLPMMLETGAFRVLRELGDARAGLKDVPLTFSRRSAGLRDAFRFLAPGRVLFMALDGGHMSPEDRYDAGGFSFYAKQGASRIAAQTGALLMSVSVRRTRGVHFEITFGQPLGPEVMADPAAATQHLVRELWHGLEQHPTDLYWTTLESVSPELRVDRCGWL